MPQQLTWGVRKEIRKTSIEEVGKRTDDYERISNEYMLKRIKFTLALADKHSITELLEETMQFPQWLIVVLIENERKKSQKGTRNCC